MKKWYDKYVDPYATSNIICNKRIERGLTQEDLAEILDVSRVAVSGWENGVFPSLKHLLRFAELYECSLNELIVYRFPIRESDERDQLVPLKFNMAYSARICA